MKLGVFDSGIGGVTVLHALEKQFPNEEFVYFGDTAHVPYGTKSAAQIRILSSAAAQRIREEGVDALVVACNTASSLALREIEAVMGDIPVFGMVEAGVSAVTEAVSRMSALGPIVIFGTRATVRSGVYGKTLRAALPARQIFEQACPLLVPMIEEGWIKHPVLDLTLGEYTAPYLERDSTSSGVALLACTHYPWIKEAFQRALPGWQVIDSADAVVARLKDEDRLRALVSKIPPKERVRWFFSDPEVAGFIFEGAAEKPVIHTF